MHIFQPATLAALAAGNASIAQLVDMDLDIPWRVNTSAWDLKYLGNTYLGAGAVARIDVIEDSPGELKSLKFSIPAVNPEDIAEALLANIQGREVIIYTAIYNTLTFASLDVYVEWAGRLDVMTLIEQDKYDLLEVTAEHIGLDLLRPSGLMYTHEDQQKLYPGDNSFEYVIDQSTKQIIFPMAQYFRR